MDSELDCDEIIYGVAIAEENDQELFAQSSVSASSAECFVDPGVTPTAVSFPNDYEYEVVDNDLCDVIEILAHSEEGVAVMTASPVAMPIDMNLEFISAYPFEISEAECFPEDIAQDIDKYYAMMNGTDIKVVEASHIEEKKSSDSFFSVEESVVLVDAFCQFGPFFIEEVYSTDEKRVKRQEAITRWQKKRKLKRSSSSLITTAAGEKGALRKLSSLTRQMVNPRQEASERRERDQGGKFRKKNLNWVSVTDLFNASVSGASDGKDR